MTGPAATATHAAAVCNFVHGANRAATAVHPTIAAGATCAAAAMTDAATPAGAELAVCCSAAAAAAAVAVRKPRRRKNVETFSNALDTRFCAVSSLTPSAVPTERNERPS